MPQPMTHHHPVMQDLIKALGLDKMRVRGFTMRCYVDEAVTITVEQYMHSTDVPDTITDIKKFKLVEIEDADTKSK